MVGIDVTVTDAADCCMWRIEYVQLQANGRGGTLACHQIADVDRYLHNAE